MSTYTAKQLAEDLTAKLDAGLSPLDIAKWAYEVYLARCRDLVDDGTRQALMKLFAMSEGPEFEYTHDELRQMADELRA